MLVHKGGKIKNWGGECRDVTSFCENSKKIKKKLGGRGGGRGSVGGVGLGGGQGGCERRIEVFVKIQKKKFGGGGGVVRWGGGGGSGSGWGVRVDVNSKKGNN